MPAKHFPAWSKPRSSVGGRSSTGEHLSAMLLGRCWNGEAGNEVRRAMEHGLERLNELPDAVAEAELLACGGARRWAHGMIARRPFRDRGELLAAADELWRGLGREDWLE